MRTTKIILFIDDDCHIHDQVKTKLKSFKLISAFSGEQAIEVLELGELKIDLIIIDQMMPQVDGLTTFRIMKSKLGDQLPPAILMTGYGSETLVLAAMRAGIASYINKPITNFKLLHVEIEDTLEKEKLKKEIKMNQIQLKKLSSAVEQSPASVLITDRNGSIEYVNPAFTTASGYTFEEVRGKNPRILKSEKLDGEFYTNMWETICAGNKWFGEFCNQTKDGKIFWESASIAPVRNVDGEITSFISVKLDITDRKKLEYNLMQAKETAENAATVKGDFLANMSHEIRTPMNGVMGMVNLLLKTELDKIQLGYADNIKSSADTLLRVINDILDFSKIEAGKLKLDYIDFNLQSLVENIADVLTVQAEAKGLELINKFYPGIPVYLKGDPGRLRQIFTNLISNAIKFSEEGEIIIRVNLDNETPQTATFKFEIEDKGIGISKANQVKIFDSFTQADASTTRKFGGTGLGLSICKQLTMLMNGQIGLESEIGRGSTFWFTAVFDKQKDAITERVFLPDNIQGKRILAVDDSVTNIEILEDYLDTWGCQYCSVNNGMDALKLLRESAGSNPFELVIIDYMMPGMNGEQLGEKIKKDQQLKNTKMIMYTSHAQQGDAKRVEKIGFDAYLIKPIKQSQLYESMVTVLFGKPTGILTRHSIREKKAITSPGKLHILLVEDNLVNFQIAKEILSERGYLVSGVHNGKEALEKLNGMVKFDLILMDVQMPVMDGFEATQQIRQIPRIQRIPVIAMTAHAMQGDREKCLAAGMDDYVSKPINGDLLFLTIERVLKLTSKTPNPTTSNEIEVDGEIFDGMIKDSFKHNPKGMLKMINLYLGSKQNAQRLTNIEKAIAEKNAEMLKKNAHAFQGSTSNFSTATAALAEALELMGKSGEVDQKSAKEIYKKLMEKFELLKKKLTENIKMMDINT